MAMTSTSTSLIPTSSSNYISILLILSLLFLLSPTPSYCTSSLLNPKQHTIKDTTSLKGLVVVAEKTRLGSTPPSCHNKCNQCHPCMATQVPSIPSRHDQVPVTKLKQLDYFDSSSSPGNRYSNYKPLGWKCRCNGNFYNP